MISRWTSHLKTEEEKEKFKGNVLGSRITLNRLSDICSELEEEEERSSHNYEVPNWALTQADSVGFKRCLAIFKKLTDPDQQKNKEITKL